MGGRLCQRGCSSVSKGSVVQVLLGSVSPSRSTRFARTATHFVAATMCWVAGTILRAPVYICGQLRFVFLFQHVCVLLVSQLCLCGAKTTPVVAVARGLPFRVCTALVFAVDRVRWTQRGSLRAPLLRQSNRGCFAIRAKRVRARGGSHHEQRESMWCQIINLVYGLFHVHFEYGHDFSQSLRHCVHWVAHLR